MGWSYGSVLMNAIIKAVRPEVPNEAARKRIYSKIVKVLEGEDWDTQDESMGIDPVADRVLVAANPRLRDD